MKNFENLNVYDLTTTELAQVEGGNWLEDIAYGVGYVAGKVTHAVIDAALFISGKETC